MQVVVAEKVAKSNIGAGNASILLQSADADKNEEKEK